MVLSIATNLGLAVLVSSQSSTARLHAKTSLLLPATPAARVESSTKITATPEGGRIDTKVDDASYVAQLRADGFPTEIIRDVYWKKKNGPTSPRC
jgi:hypothetical protein